MGKTDNDSSLKFVLLVAQEIKRGQRMSRCLVIAGWVSERIFMIRVYQVAYTERNRA